MISKSSGLSNKLIADFSLLIVAIIWGSGFIVAKYGLDHITPLYLNTFRFTVAFIILSIFNFDKISKANKEVLVGGLVIGFFLYSAFAFQTIALQFTTPGKQAFLTATNVIMVPFLYWIVKGSKPSNYSLAASALSFIGIGFLTLDNGFFIQLGDGLTLICAFLFACHIVSIGFYSRKCDPILLTIVQLGVAAIFSLVSALIFEDLPSSMPRAGYLAGLYLGIFSTLIAFTIQNIAQKHTSSTHAAIMLSLEAFFGSILSVIVFKEVFTARMLIGCLTIFLGIITAETQWSFLLHMGTGRNYNKNI